MSKKPFKKPVSLAPVNAAAVAETAVANASPAAFVEAAEEFKSEVTAKVSEVQTAAVAGAEKALVEARAVVSKVQDEAKDVGSAVESSVSVLTKGFAELNAKVLGAVRSNSEATIELFKAAFAAKSPSELITLQSEHARKQLEIFSAQVKDFSSTASKIAEDAAKPIKAKVEKALAA